MKYILIISEMFKYGVVTSNQIFKKGGAITLFLIIGLLPITGFAQDSHFTNFSSWSIDDSDLTNGKLVLNSGEVKTIHYHVSIHRDLDEAGQLTNAEVHFVCELVTENLVNGNLNNPVSDFIRMNILGEAEPGNTTADLTFKIGGDGPNTTFGAGVSRVKNGDQLILLVMDGSGEKQAPKKYDITVNPSTTPSSHQPIVNYGICCNQCILAGETPTLLGNTIPAPASSISYIEWRKKNSNTTNWDILNIRTNDYDPGPILVSTDFRRVVHSCCYDVVSMFSNIITISISSLKPALSVPATFYQGNELIKAGIITIQGDQAINGSRSSPDLQVSFVGARQIVISANTRISDNMHFTIDPSIATCGTSGRIAVSEVDTTLTVIETPQKATVTTHSENINFLNAYPNPTDGDMTIKYSIAKKGSVKLYISDNLGRPITTLVDSKTAEPGKYEVVYNSQGDITGVYFCTLISNGYKEVKKLIITNQSQSK